jgi:hypothetical protein
MLTVKSENKTLKPLYFETSEKQIKAGKLAVSGKTLSKKRSPLYA